jgi:chitinase
LTKKADASQLYLGLILFQRCHHQKQRLVPLQWTAVQSKFSSNHLFTQPPPRRPTMNGQLPRRLVLVAAVVIGCFPARESLADDAKLPDGNVFVGYVFRRPEKINFSLYTHLCHAFIVADEDGTIRPNRSCPSRELVADAHQANVRVLISLGGWGWDKQFAAIVSKPESEDRYVMAVMTIVDEYDYDGIDLDWEYPDTKDEIVGYERLCRRFRKQLDELGQRKGRHLFQTMAAAANPPTLKWLTNDLLLETMDWVNIMTYDMAGDWTSYAGHHSPLFASSKQPGPPRSTELSMKYLVERGMPANRLAVGLPLYGKGFSVKEPYASTKNKTTTSRVPRGGNYSNIARLIEQGWTRQWDDETKNPWTIAPDGSAVIGYDDAESIALKTEWAMRQGFRGVFFWQIGGDLLADGSNPLQEAARQKLDASVSKANGK